MDFRPKCAKILVSCHVTCCCDNSDCRQQLQDEYNVLIDCLKCADSTLPRYKPGTEKDWWSSELTSQRHQSIAIHSLWINEGRPRQSRTYDERLRVRAAYKRAIWAAQRAPKQQSRNKIHSSLELC